MKVLLIEEIPERERLSLLLLKYAIEKRGHDVEIENVWDIEMLDPNDYDVVIDNISDSVSHYIGKWWNMDTRTKYINLIWEQMPNPINIDRYRFDSRICKRYVDGRIAWSSKFKEIISFQNPSIDADRIGVTGSMQYAIGEMHLALSKKKFNHLYPFDFENYERVIFIPESFPYASSNVNKNEEKKTSINFKYELSKYNKILLEEFSSMINRFAERRDDHLFIIRSHPKKEKSDSLIYNKIGNKDNLKYNNKGDINTLIRISDLVISPTSGALINSYFLKTPSVRVFLDVPIESTYIFDSIQQAFSASASIKTLQNIDIGELISRVRQKKEKDDNWFEIKGIRVFERTALFIEKIHNQKKSVEKQVRWKDILSRRSAFRLARYYYRRYIRGNSLRYTRSYDYQEVAESIIDVSDLDK